MVAAGRYGVARCCGHVSRLRSLLYFSGVILSFSRAACLKGCSLAVWFECGWLSIFSVTLGSNQAYKRDWRSISPVLTAILSFFQPLLVSGRSEDAGGYQWTEIVTVEAV